MPRRRITFRQLETFAKVAELRGYSRAAEVLHLTQPAISIQIRQIAEVLGLPLFEQNGRNAELTAAGHELFATIRELDDVWTRFETAIDGLKGLRRGRLRVALVTTAKYFLPRLLGEFCKRYPEIDIELEVANRERIVERIRANMDDLYVMAYPPEDIDVVSYPFLDNEMVVVAPLEHPARGRPVELTELAGERFILREPGSGARRTIDPYLAQRGIVLNVKLSLSSNEAIRELVAGGMGLSILSRHALPAEPEKEGLAVLEVKGFPLRKSWSVVHRKGKVLSLPAEAFMQELLQTVWVRPVHSVATSG